MVPDLLVRVDVLCEEALDLVVVAGQLLPRHLDAVLVAIATPLLHRLELPVAVKGIRVQLQRYI